MRGRGGSICRKYQWPQIVVIILIHCKNSVCRCFQVYCKVQDYKLYLSEVLGWTVSTLKLQSADRRHGCRCLHSESEYRPLFSCLLTDVGCTLVCLCSDRLGLTVECCCFHYSEDCSRNQTHPYYTKRFAKSIGMVNPKRCSPEKKQLFFRALLKFANLVPFQKCIFWSIKGVFFFQNVNNCYLGKRQH